MSDGDFFSKHIGPMHLAGFEGLETFFGKISPLSLFIFSVIFSLLFHPVSSLVLLIFSSCLLSSLLSIFSCLVLNLLFHLLLSSCLVSPLSSSLVFLSRTVFSFSVSLCLSLSLSVSLCLSPSLSLSPCDVVCCVVWCVSLWSWCCLVVVVCVWCVCLCVAAR